MLYGQFVGVWTTVTTAWLVDGTGETTSEMSASPGCWRAAPFRSREAGLLAAPQLCAGKSRATATARRCECSTPPSTLGTSCGSTRQVQPYFDRSGPGRRRIQQNGEVAADGSTPRWVYRDIRSTSFRWSNERSIDGGQAWRLVQEMRAKRLSQKPRRGRSAATDCWRLRRRLMWFAEPPPSCRLRWALSSRQSRPRCVACVVTLERWSISRRANDWRVGGGPLYVRSRPGAS